ncbi:unnamed protein product, partial [Ectocarpus sp. 12 AP-2014]
GHQNAGGWLVRYEGDSRQSWLTGRGVSLAADCQDTTFSDKAKKLVGRQRSRVRSFEGDRRAPGRFEERTKWEQPQATRDKRSSLRRSR